MTILPWKFSLSKQISIFYPHTSCFAPLENIELLFLPFFFLNIHLFSLSELSVDFLPQPRTGTCWRMWPPATTMLAIWTTKKSAWKAFSWSFKAVGSKLFLDAQFFAHYFFWSPNAFSFRIYLYFFVCFTIWDIKFYKWNWWTC